VAVELVVGIVIVGLILGLAAICAMKGKWAFAILGLFVNLLLLIGAIRLAKPGSFWAKRWYDAEKLDRAVQRFDASRLSPGDDPTHPEDSARWEDEPEGELDKITRRAHRRERRRASI
jgi:hypothetical protein